MTGTAVAPWDMNLATGTGMSTLPSILTAISDPGNERLGRAMLMCFVDDV
jgi:hypothetical protein